MSPIEKEISFSDLVSVVKKHKKLSFSVFLATLVIGFAYHIFQPRLYKAEAVFRLASVSGTPVISKNDVSQVIFSDVVFKNGFQEKGTDRINIYPLPSGDFVMLTVFEKDPQLARNICLELTNSFFKYGRLELNKRLEILDERLKLTEQQITNLRKEQETINSIIKGVYKKPISIENQIMGNLLLLVNMYSANQEHLNNLLNDKLGLEEKLLNIRDFEIINFPMNEKIPITSANKKSSALFAFAAVTLSLCVPFVSEYVKKQRLVLT